MPIEVYPGLFRIEAPLPGNPLKSINAWLAVGKKRSLLIDNGFNMPACMEAILAGLHKLGLSPQNLDFFITHLHSDHNGLTSQLSSSGSRIFCGLEDGHHINMLVSRPDMWVEEIFTLKRHGFPPADLQIIASTHPGRIYANPQPIDFIAVSDGDVLQYGKFAFHVLHTPGHTPGHMALYEPEHSFLIAGDHILGAITPNITCWNGMNDALGTYLHSLQSVASLDIAVTFPGHRENIANTGKRIKELVEHHVKRLEEVKCILAGAQANAWQVAASMKWSLRGNWSDYPLAQKFFAVGEALAHLEHLEKIGDAARIIDPDGNIVFTLRKTEE